MNVDLKKTSHILFFVVFLPGVSLGIGWVFVQLLPNAPFWVETLSPLGAYGLLYGLFDRFLWHWPIFRLLGITSCPDVRGRWLGDQVSSWKGEDGKHRTSRVILEIKQTFSGLEACTYYYKWHSNLSVAEFVQIQNQPTLVMLFEAEPKADYDGTAKAHKGVMKLIKNPDSTLTGTYFNAEGNSGELAFRRTNYKIYGLFTISKK